MLKHKPQIVEIIDKRQESVRVTTLYISVDNYPTVVPGQFVMVWAPEAEEIPLAVSEQRESVIAISIDRVGPTTEILCSKTVGEVVGLRGPYGRGFDLKSGSNYLLVGSGCGVSPLIFASSRLKESGKKVDMVIDARSKEELCFIDWAEKMGISTFISTHDGSMGFRGYGSELVKEIISGGYDFVLSCGPEPMMREVNNICIKLKIMFQSSLERYMRCGFGLCGSCAIDPTGHLVCLDGPVFDGETLSKMSSIGNSKRLRNGSVKKI